MAFIKAVVVGDGFVGKTSLLYSYTSNTVPSDHLPTVYDNFSTTALVNGEAIELNLNDTAGQAEYDRLRPLIYPGSHVVLICFSVTSEKSMNNVMRKWHPEVAHFCPGVPVLLVGTKIDLRDSTDPKMVSTNQGKKAAEKIKAHRYMECSALTQVGVKDVFSECIKAALKTNSHSEKGCSIL